MLFLGSPIEVAHCGWRSAGTRLIGSFDSSGQTRTASTLALRADSSALCSPGMITHRRTRTPPQVDQRQHARMGGATCLLSSQSEGASDTHHIVDDRDGFREALNPSRDLLPDGLVALPDGQISDPPCHLLVQPRLQKYSGFPKTQITSISL